MTEKLEPPRPVDRHDSRDPLLRMRVYVIAKELLPDCFSDCSELTQNPVTVKIAPQLYKAVGSIATTMSEGYSRASGRDRAKFFEYSLGSVRESMDWYDASAQVLSSEILENRLGRLEEMRRMLLAIIPREREKQLRKAL